MPNLAFIFGSNGKLLTLIFNSNDSNVHRNGMGNRGNDRSNSRNKKRNAGKIDNANDRPCFIPCNRGYYMILAQGLFASEQNKRYDKTLSKKHASGKPYRHLLAFFVSIICLASQAGKHDHTTPINLLTSKMFMGITVYDGLTLQNKIAERRICRAVACVTESKTRHPIYTGVILTQKQRKGVSRND